MRTKPLLLALVALVAASACGKDQPSTPSTGTSSSKPAPSTPSITGIGECDDYVKAVDQYLACPNVAQVMKDDTLRARKNLEGRWQNAGDADKPDVAKACAVAAKAARDNTHRGGCDAAP
jgi:hypothetical protein